MQQQKLKTLATEMTTYACYVEGIIQERNVTAWTIKAAKIRAKVMYGYNVTLTKI